LQLIENKKLRDENILFLKAGKPWIVSKVTRTKKSANITYGNGFGGGKTSFSFNVSTNEDFFPYPEVNGNGGKNR